MEVRIQWFGLSWAVSVLIAILAAVVLIVTARRQAKQGNPTGLFQIGAVIEVAVLVLDVIIRVGVHSSRLFVPGQTDWGLRVLDAWTLMRPLAHGVVLTLVAVGLRRQVKARDG